MQRGLILAMLVAVTGHVLAQTAEYPRVQFLTLANYTYNQKEPYDPTPHQVMPSGVPAQLWALDGQKIAILGLGIPLVWDKDGANEFMLTLSEDACNFGVVPRINEWIYVKMKGTKKIPLYLGNEYLVKGVFHLKETVEDGLVVMLYSMDADSAE